MNRQFTKVCLIALLISLTASFTPYLNAAPSKEESSKKMSFHDAMRKLWEDHITWTRVFIISAAGDLPDKATATDRLLQNQVEIGNAIKPYYGDAAGNKLTSLLKEHITIAAEVVAAAKANDSAKLADANKRWYANGDQIVDLLRRTKPKERAQTQLQTRIAKPSTTTTE